jgi:hypothetical protein
LKCNVLGVKFSLHVFLTVHVIPRAFLRDEIMLGRLEDTPDFLEMCTQGIVPEVCFMGPLSRGDPRRLEY